MISNPHSEALKKLENAQREAGHAVTNRQQYAQTIPFPSHKSA
jgi:hypothetical protein